MYAMDLKIFLNTNNILLAVDCTILKDFQVGVTSMNW